MGIKERAMSGTIMLGASNIVLRFFSFFTILMILRELSVYEYGLFTLLMALVGVISAFSSMGMDSLLIADACRSLGEKKFSKAKSIIVYFLIIRFIILLILLFLVFIFKAGMELKYGSIITQYFWLVIFLAFAQFLKSSSAILLQIHERFKILSLFNVADVFIKFIFVAGFFILGKLSFVGLAMSYIFGMTFSVFIFLPQIKATFSNLKKFPLQKMSLIYNIFKCHGKWQVGSNLFSSLTNNIKFWLVKLIISTEAVAYLALAQNLYSVLASLIPLRTVIFPIIARKINEKQILEKILQKATKYSLFIYAIFVMAALFVISPLIPFVFPKYAVAVPLFSILVIKLLFNAFTATQPAVLCAKHDQKFLFYCNVISTFSVIIFSSLLMIRFGLIGAILEALITVMIIDIMREVYLRNKYNIKTISIKSFFSIDETDKMILFDIWANLRKKLRFNL